MIAVRLFRLTYTIYKNIKTTKTPLDSVASEYIFSHNVHNTVYQLMGNGTYVDVSRHHI